jgi:hypothetical protein
MIQMHHFSAGTGGLLWSRRTRRGFEGFVQYAGRHRSFCIVKYYNQLDITPVDQFDEITGRTAVRYQMRHVCLNGHTAVWFSAGADVDGGNNQEHVPNGAVDPESRNRTPPRIKAAHPGAGRLFRSDYPTEMANASV